MLYSGPLFSFLRNYHIDSHNRWNSLPSYQHCIKVLFGPYPINICFLNSCCDGLSKSVPPIGSYIGMFGHQGMELLERD